MKPSAQPLSKRACRRPLAIAPRRARHLAYNAAMHPPRLYCPQLQTGSISLPPVEARHALRSLRLRAGDALTLFDGHGRVASATLEPPSGTHQAPAGPRQARKNRRQTTVIVDRIQEIPPARRTLTLIVAACKGPRLDWLAEKCTELGVTKLCFAEFAHSMVHIGPHHLEKLRRTAIEACKQSGRAWLPEIEAGVELKVASARDPAATLFVAHPADDATPLAKWLVHHGVPAHRLAAVVGPEGGLSPAELAHLRGAHAHFVRLADAVLRVETAAVAVAANFAAAENPGE